MQPATSQPTRLLQGAAWHPCGVPPSTPRTPTLALLPSVCLPLSLPCLQHGSRGGGAHQRPVRHPHTRPHLPPGQVRGCTASSTASCTAGTACRAGSPWALLCWSASSLLGKPVESACSCTLPPTCFTYLPSPCCCSCVVHTLQAAELQRAGGPVRDHRCGPRHLPARRHEPGWVLQPQNSAWLCRLSITSERARRPAPEDTPHLALMCLVLPPGCTSHCLAANCRYT